MVLEFKIIYAFNRAIFVLSTSLTVGHPLASVRACSGFCHVHDIQSRKSSDDIGTRVVLKRRRTQATIWSRGQHEEWKKSSFPAEFLHNPTFPVQNFWFSKVFYIFSCFFTRSVVDGLSARARIRWRISFEKCLFVWSRYARKLLQINPTPVPNSTSRKGGSRTNTVGNHFSRVIFFTKIVIYPLHSRRRERNQQIPYRFYCRPGTAGSVVYREHSSRRLKVINVENIGNENNNIIL